MRDISLAKVSEHKGGAVVELNTIRRAVMVMVNLSRDFLGELSPKIATAFANKLNDFEWAMDVAYLDNDRQEMLRILHEVDAFSEELLEDLRKVAA